MPSLVTAKLHGLDPQTYLADVLDRIVSGRTKASALRELLAYSVPDTTRRRVLEVQSMIDESGIRRE